MLIQYITLVKIHCIICITLNYCLTEISLLKTNCRVLNPQQEDDPMKGLPDRQESFKLTYLYYVKIIIQVKFTRLYTLFVHYIENLQSLQFSMIPFHVNKSNA